METGPAKIKPHKSTYFWSGFNLFSSTVITTTQQAYQTFSFQVLGKGKQEQKRDFLFLLFIER